jgi:hypothetical protein
MMNGRETHQHGPGIVADLEPYRRLIETQRALIEMARKHEQTRRECDALREIMARQVMKRPSWTQFMFHRVQQSLFRVIKRLPPVTAAEPGFDALNDKQPFSC